MTCNVGKQVCEQTVSYTELPASSLLSMRSTE